MSSVYNVTFTSSRPLEPHEALALNKKLLRIINNDPFGEWQPGTSDQPTLSNASMHLEADPLLGYDKRWIVNAIIDHLVLTRIRLDDTPLNSQSLQALQFSLSRLDELAMEEVPGLEDLRLIAQKGIY